MPERRSADRHEVFVPINVSTSARRDRVGMIRDLSEHGVLFHSLSKYALGERVAVMFKLGGERIPTSGCVVRADLDDNADNIFRFLTAVRFDAPLLDLPLAA